MSWNGPKWTTSWHNLCPDTTSQFSFSKIIELHDWTLEGDAEEMPGVVFSLDEKLKIARMLDEVRIHRINVGPIKSAQDVNAVREIAHLGLSTKVEAHIGVSVENVDLALRSDVSGVLMEIPSSTTWLENYRQTIREAIDRSIEVATYAKAHGLSATIGMMDAPRADENNLKQIIEAWNSLHLDAVLIVDSAGVTSPEGFKHIVRMIRQWTKFPIAMHCHNDFGLATANALASLTAGASIITTTVNGIGERCGLTSLEEIAVTLRILYGIDTGIKYDKLSDLSNVVENATGHFTSKLKPIVGERAFAIEDDRSLQRILNLQEDGRLKAALPYEPDFVGNNLRLYFGKNTGKQGVKWQAERLGFKLTDRQAEQLAVKIQELSRRKQQPNDQEFLDMVTHVMRQS